MSDADADVAATLDRLVRVEGGRIVAVLAAATGDLQLAEDAVQDASIAALEVWPRVGIPVNPTGWLYVAARRKVIDIRRREATRPSREAASANHELQLRPSMPPEPEIRDDVLRLVFTCCHPSIALEARVALALRTLCGLSVADLARVFLVAEPAMTKRLVRARQKTSQAGIAFRIPTGDELPAWLASVHAVLHLAFTTGHHSTDETVVRAALCDEALRLARLVVDLGPHEPSGSALLALFLLTDARRPARLGPGGTLVPLAQQDRGRWDRAAIDEGVALLQRSLAATDGVADPYQQLQAAIAACHATAPSFATTDWPEVLRLYRLLADVYPSPVVQLNAAVAIAEVEGPAAALAALDDVPPAGRTHLFHVARADLLRRLGRHDEADAARARAVEESPTDAERDYLRAQAPRASVER